MVPALRSVSAVLVLAAAAACVERVPDNQAFDTAFTETADLFVEYRLPNSMGRPPAFDLDRHLREVEARRREVSRIFHSPAGVQFVTARIQDEPDELVVLAGLEILSESRHRSAIPVFEHLSKSSSPVVAEWAQRYLVEAAAWP